ncbi:MAG: DUF305 domain-containing protein [Cyanobacteria bacterium REEB459]|nr:DUF305 domain-containing protein [Cyanobacteria bacterium REEB459]
MRLPKRSFAAIAGVSLAAAGAITVAYLASPSRANSLGQLGRLGWPMPLAQGHHGGMMPMMQVNNEFEFLSLMIPHHQEAIDTAQRVLEFSDRPEMREFAQAIITVQTAEIKQMETWLGEWYPGQKTNLTYRPMMGDLSQLKGNALDRAFLEGMVMHHQEAVMMAQHLVYHGLVKHPAVQPFAQNIANTQRQEIAQMQTWLQDWYGVSTTPCPMHGYGSKLPGT